jgi:hypothetical protein
MATKYWLAPISSNTRPTKTDDLDPVDEHWLERHGWLLGLVGTSQKRSAIQRGDLVIFYAKTHKKIVAVAHVTAPGDADVDASPTGADHALSVQVRLAIPRITVRAPSYETIPGVDPGHIQGGRPIELDRAQFLAGWNAIAASALPDDLDPCAGS